MRRPATEPKTKAMKPLSPGEGNFRLEKIGVKQFELGDPYHFALAISWTQFFVGLIAVYLLINLVFALLYYLAPGSVVNLPAGSLVDAFFFSIETLATVGYGNMAPVTLYSHVISAIEIIVGMVLTATMTGLVFVRFSRPKAKVLFANHAVVSRSGGQAQLMIRIGNGRMHALYDASVRVTTLVTATSPDGQQFRRMVDLDLQRFDLPFFPLTWTLIHVITDDSPLAELRQIDQQGLMQSGLRILVSMTMRDPSLGAQVYAAHSYTPQDIALDMRYGDAITVMDENHSVADMGKISDMEPDPA
ncbi:MAG: Inward rectifier potassium channel [Rhodoferax sp.]|nr:Inward rectifier potassium channel [Rhodoferax sp.]